MHTYMYLTKLYLPVLIYPPEWKETVTVTCLAQEHNTMFPARARGQTAQNRKEIQKSNNRLFMYMSQQCRYYAKITIHDFEIYFRQST